ncbi:MAG: hypothetical protein ACRCYX_04095 [Dermatophilaceae bacterium]
MTETPTVAAALELLRRRRGDETPTLEELIVRGAQAVLRELDARDGARSTSLATFVDRLSAGPEPDLDEFSAIRHYRRHP